MKRYCCEVEPETNRLLQYNEGFHDGYNQAMSEMPTVVRCKDCKHGYRCKNAAGEDCVECSNHYVSLESICRKPDWFCADGERKQS